MLKFLTVLAPQKARDLSLAIFDGAAGQDENAGDAHGKEHDSVADFFPPLRGPEAN